MSVQEGTHTLADGKQLFTKTFRTDGPPKARLVFIHGFSDHVHTYGDFFPGLAAKGIEVYTFDQRGWGRSVSKPSERGDTGPTEQVLDDMTSFLKTVISTPSPAPLFLMGHSMGGGQTLCYAAHGPAEVREHIRGYLLESPFVDFDPKSKPSAVTVFLGRLAGKLAKKRQLVNKLDPMLLARDPEVGKRFEEDTLCHNTGTLEGLAGMLDRTSALASGKVVIPDNAGEGGVTRIWIAHGDKDGITSYAASKRLFDALQVKDKEFKSYAGHYHRRTYALGGEDCRLTDSVHDEPSPDKEAFRDDVVNWILARCTDPAGVDGAKPRL